VHKVRKVFWAILGLLFHFSINATPSQNNTIMITAATGSFGKAVSASLAAEGYNLIIAGRNQRKLDDLKSILKAKYPEVTVQSLFIDFSDTKTIEAAAKHIPQGSIKGIVLIGPRPSLSTDGIPNKEEWSKVFAETFIGPLEVVRLFSSMMQSNGSIVIISGNSSKSYVPNYPNTNVIRLAWAGEVKNLVYFFAERKIRVNAISPGVIFTQHHKEKIEAAAVSNKITFKEQLAKDTSSIPLKSYGKTEDVANLISFLLCDKSGHMNGTNSLLDGGESTAY
jgi:3-oxoacyl-[acyl-carrier protein] reductase